MALIGDYLEWFWILCPTGAELCGPENRKLRAHSIALLLSSKVREIVMGGEVGVGPSRP